MTTKRDFMVSNISCAHCSDTTEKALAAVDGVNSVLVDITSRTVGVEWDETTASYEEIGASLRGTGYPEDAG